MEDTSEQQLRVIKRNGHYEEVSFDKILKRVRKLGNECTPPLKINYGQLVMKVIDQLYPNIKTHVIDEITAEQCASLSTKHLDYGYLASRITVSNNHKNTLPSFYEAMKQLYDFKDVTGNHSSLIHEDLWAITQEHKDVIEDEIDYSRDYYIDYFGFKTLERAYLMRVNKVIVERPQHLWMRVAIGIHGSDMPSVKETYNLMSKLFFTHATPTLFNAGTPRPQLSSCYLIGMESDSIDGIYNTLKECAQISKWAGGIGLHIHNVRASGTHIRGTNGTSNGIVPMLSVFNKTARYVDQGGGKRNGSFAVYLEPWHADIVDFLNLKKNTGDEEMRARDLFYALWIPSLFMERVKVNGEWSLMCPDVCPGLADCYGDEFNTLYNKYCSEGKVVKTMKARDLWFQILDSQMETGTPYLLYKDHANNKSNHKNIGVIKSSNLCVAPETKILTDKGHIEIQTLENTKVNVWNGVEFSEVEVKRTNDDAELVTVVCTDGSELICTKYHKFYIQDKITTSIHVVEAQNLENNMRLMSCEYPIIDSGLDFDAENIDLTDTSFVPINYSIKSKMEWFSRVCDEYSLVNTICKIQYLYVASLSKSYLLNIKLMLQECGVSCRVAKAHTIDEWRLFISSNNLQKLLNLGFSCQKLKTTDVVSEPEEARFIHIKEVISNNRRDKTYCFNESKRHTGIFNGIITSNCTEIMEYSDSEQTAVCNLASIALSKFINDDKTFNYEYLHHVTKVVTRNLDRIIDVNYYPTQKTQKSNLLHRPIGIGVQGLADAFALMDIAYHSDETIHVNKLIFETIYHASMESSNEIAISRTNMMNELGAYNAVSNLFTERPIVKNSVCREYIYSDKYIYNKEMEDKLNLCKPIPNEMQLCGKDIAGAYSSFEGSPVSNGEFQFDMWGVKPTDRYDWDKLKNSVKQYGVRNSLLVAPMPTASTSQILGNNECFEPFTSNIYTRRTLAGEFVMVNKYLMKELIDLGVWNDEIKDSIIVNKGSVQHIEGISDKLKEKYKIVWEIPMKHMIDMSADRGAFICQSQSLNLWMEDPDYKSLTSMHFYAWQKGLKTGIYYLRRKPKHQPQQFTIGPSVVVNTEPEICEMCSS